LESEKNGSGGKCEVTNMLFGSLISTPMLLDKDKLELLNFPGIA